jgi:regulatory protein
MNAANDQTLLLKAKRSVYRLLKIRMRSEGEIRSKLKQKEIPKNIIDQTIAYFKNHKMIDDVLFTKQWMSYRLNRPFGLSRIRLELVQKGIARDIIDEELKRAKEETPENSIVLEVAKRRIKQYKDIDPVKAKQRLYGYLTRRGFSPSSIAKALTWILSKGQNPPEGPHD